MVRIEIGKILSPIDYSNHFYIDDVFTKSRYPIHRKTNVTYIF